MKVTVKERYAAELTYEVCRAIAKKLNLPEEFKIEYKSGHGRFVLFEEDGKKYYVIVSGKDANDARNAFLNQYVTTVLRKFVEDEAEDKRIYAYVLDTSAKAKVKFIADGYRVLKTMGIYILNEDELNIAVKPYASFEDWKNAQDKRRDYNSGNNSSYAIEDEEGGYTLFGKLYGANGKDAAMTACMLAGIARANDTFVRFVQVREHGTEEIAETDGKLLKHFGVIIGEGAIVLENKSTKDKSTCRHQDEFKFNLLEKYGGKKCYMCSCDIESNIIASHIHRICDIDKSGLSEEEKRRQAVDPDNGFWLCANHDKMFEVGNVTYALADGKLVISPVLKPNQTDFVKRITEKYGVESAHFTENLKGYLKIHNIRVNLGL